MAIVCDVLIVGGGPAGLAAAIALRQRGVDVMVADAQRPPIDKACGEGLMPDSLPQLARLGVAIDAGRGHPADGIRFDGIRFQDEHSSATAEFPGGPGVGVRRLTLHRLLMERASQLAVRAHWQTHVVLTPGHPAAIAGSPVTYRCLIGADGQSSRVRSWAGFAPGTLLSRRFGFRIHYRLPPHSVAPRHVEVHWGPLGQAYVTPVGDREICVAVLTRPHDRTRCDQVLRSLPGLRNLLAGAEAITSERGALTTTRSLSSVVRGNIALIGDASGSCDAITGEGLTLGFRQALLLADALSRNDLALYDTVHPRLLRLPQAMARVLLLLDRWPSLRRRTLAAFAEDPTLFQQMLHVHLGADPLWRLPLVYAPALGRRMLLPFPA